MNTKYKILSILLIIIVISTISFLFIKNQMERAEVEKSILIQKSKLDSDQDGFRDWLEVLLETDAINPTSFPNTREASQKELLNSFDLKKENVIKILQENNTPITKEVLNFIDLYIELIKQDIEDRQFVFIKLKIDESPNPERFWNSLKFAIEEIFEIQNYDLIELVNGSIKGEQDKKEILLNLKINCAQGIDALPKIVNPNWIDIYSIITKRISFVCSAIDIGLEADNYEDIILLNHLYTNVLPSLKYSDLSLNNLLEKLMERILE